MEKRLPSYWSQTILSRIEEMIRIQNASLNDIPSFLLYVTLDDPITYETVQHWSIAVQGTSVAAACAITIHILNALFGLEAPLLPTQSMAILSKEQAFCQYLKDAIPHEVLSNPTWRPFCCKEHPENMVVFTYDPFQVQTLDELYKILRHFPWFGVAIYEGEKCVFRRRTIGLIQKTGRSLPSFYVLSMPVQVSSCIKTTFEEEWSEALPENFWCKKR